VEEVANVEGGEETIFVRMRRRTIEGEDNSGGEHPLLRREKLCL